MVSFDLPSDEAMAKLREAHGELSEVYDPETGRMFVLTKPQNARAVLQRFQSVATGPGGRFEALEGLAKACVVHPDRDTLKRVFEDEPGLVFAIGEAGLGLLGVRQLAAKKG